jgi:hypothetical protein
MRSFGFCVLAFLAAPLTQTQTYNLLYTFRLGVDGTPGPGSGVVRDATENLYGTPPGTARSETEWCTSSAHRARKRPFIVSMAGRMA